VKIFIISALAAASALTAALLPWIESAPVQQAQCVVAGSGGSNPTYVTICPTQGNPV
jgi:hypothetical protein